MKYDIILKIIRFGFIIVIPISLVMVVALVWFVMVDSGLSIIRTEVSKVQTFENLIKQCEKDLPRHKHCKLIAVVDDSVQK
jgi:hypothetical protein